MVTIAAVLNWLASGAAWVASRLSKDRDPKDRDLDRQERESNLAGSKFVSEQYQLFVKEMLARMHELDESVKEMRTMNKEDQATIYRLTKELDAERAIRAASQEVIHDLKTELEASHKQIEGK